MATIPAGQSTPEYLTLKKSFNYLVAEISAQPGEICGALFARDLVTPTIVDHVTTGAIPPREKAERIMTTVMTKVEFNPSVFHVFMDILKNVGSSLASIVEQLEGDYKAEQAKHSSKVLFDSVPDLHTPVEEPKPANIADNKAGDGETKPDHQFECPYCGKCTVEQFCSDARCPIAKDEEGKTLFPYLDCRHLTTDEREQLECRLMKDTREMVTLFASTDHSILKSLKAQQIELAELVNYVGHLVKECASEADVKVLKQSTTIAEVFCALHPYKSFFHYEILEEITKEFGSDDDQKRMKEYVAKFNAFCERSVFEVPSRIFHRSTPKPGDKVFSIKFSPKVPTSLSGVVDVRQKLAGILNIKPAALQLCSIEKGCVLLKFLISAHLADKVFPLSPSQTSALSDMHLRILEGPSPLENESQLEGEQDLAQEKVDSSKSSLTAVTQAATPPPVLKTPRMEEVIKVTATARANLHKQTICLEDWENEVELACSNCRDIDTVKIKKFCKKQVEILETSIALFQRELKRIYTSSLSLSSLIESDGIEVAYEDVTQESIQQKRPVPIPRTRRSQSLSTPPQQKRPVPLPRTRRSQSFSIPPVLPCRRYYCAATPKQQTPIKHIEGATASESVAIEDDFTGGTGDSGVGTGQSDRMTWIQNSDIPPEEHSYELVGPSPDSQQYTSLHDIDDVPIYDQPMRTPNIEELIMVLKERKT